MGRAETLMDMYDAMLGALGPSHWWPGETPLEIAVGAVLTQNTNWKNVSQAIDNLKRAGLLDVKGLLALPVPELEEFIRPAGYFRLKAGRLRNLLAFIDREVDGDIGLLGDRDFSGLREALLGVKGIGPETADAILCYALDYPVFVVDAYTARMFQRHGLVPNEADYHELQAFVMDVLPRDVALFNEYHALIVRVGKDWCKKQKGLCETCPLQPFLS
ncbi:endonuclease III domain-containing protein [Salidesulfovibrio onnuriiensis]|uniref:endonuclease III domain-containing protein n=1 Tax=Salidesulfovibrio onnuriiensis TaxID=2583823 RepID=UPI0011C983A5|nr:endonuclease III domain-containing protein [Salidesulfovibrio onnuriiensis]